MIRKIFTINELAVLYKSEYGFIKGLYLLLITSFVGLGCSTGYEEPSLFHKMSPDQTGVTFNNEITSSDSLNNYNYPFIYHGGGVAIGDINNDGLSELFFTGNMVSSRLYLNKGNMEFEDITESAGVGTDRWATGASMVDINNDGYLDIYVTAVSPDGAPERERANLLFINNGDNTFTESAARYNIDDTGHTTHSAFLDYDKDGDLDLFLLNHHPGLFARNNAVRPASSTPFGRSTTSYDELYRNEGDGSFTKVGREAGIVQQEGFGLGVAVSDINLDGWPDIYVSNDVITNDVIYINNQDGTFIDKTAEYLKHSSFAGMGVDIADFNNDGWPDIYQTEMMPDDYVERKKMSGGVSYQHYLEMRAKGYLHQYPLNTLQLSNGRNENGDLVFSEIARLAGVAYTDWSWSSLFGDYDNDGHKDILVTNGFPKAINNYDFLQETNEVGRFGTPEIKQQKRIELLENLHGYEVPNYIYRNRGDLTFEDKSEAWNFDEPGYSYGASHADLDNDGDLDIVISNINAHADIYQNRTDTLQNKHHYLAVRFNGPPSNTKGVGARVKVESGSEEQYQYFSPYRGFQSTTDDKLLFGLGEKNNVDTLEVVWPDYRYQIITEIEADQLITLNYENAAGSYEYTSSSKSDDYYFKNITAESNVDYQHTENEFNDYSMQVTLPYQLSKLGPALASGDVNGDGLEDFYIGGASGQPGALYLQNEDGGFQKSNQAAAFAADSDYEDIDALFFDANGNGHLDLYVTSGGYEFSPASELLQDRLYINRGNGEFVRNEGALPRMFTSSSVVKSGDFDGDSDLDLFVGGRLVPGRYPYPANSYILRNDQGTFTDVTDEIAPELIEPGLITDAELVDFNNDGTLDLITVGEWMPVRFYKNEEGLLQDITAELGLELKTGWWYSLETGDFDNDGDLDIIAGNLGLNYRYRASEDQKFELFASDFDGDQSTDLIFSVEDNGVQVPIYGKPKITREMPPVDKRFRTFESFAEANVEDIVGTEKMEEALHLQATTFSSVYIENEGEDGFTMKPLPNEAQFSSVQDFVISDVDHDGNLDIILAGNIYNSEPETPRNDAGNGLWLKGNGDGSFTPISPFESGLLTPLDVKSMELIEDTPEGKILLVGNNDAALQVIKIK